jgi:hypothetical protein
MRDYRLIVVLSFAAIAAGIILAAALVQALI